MQRGNLQTTPLPDLLQQLSEARATGCVYLMPSEGRGTADEAMVALRDGTICSVQMPDGSADESIGTRLVASQRMTPAALAEAREAQETELANWPLAELLIHLSLADEPLVQALLLERALADLSELCSWRAGSWRFRRRERWGPSLPNPLDVEDALTTVAARGREWAELLPVIGSADAVVLLAAAHEDDRSDDHSMEVDADGFALLCSVDGVRTVEQLGKANGFTLLDAGRTVAALAHAGLIQVQPDDEAEALTDAELDVAGPDDFDPPVTVGGSDEDEDSLGAIAAALTFDGPLLPEDVGQGFAPVGAPWQPPRTSKGDGLADALARVSAALSEAMNGPVDEPQHMPVVEVTEVTEVVEVVEVVEVADVTELAETPAQPERILSVVPDLPEPEVAVEDEQAVEPEVIVEDEATVEVLDEPAEEVVDAAVEEAVEEIEQVEEEIVAELDEVTEPEVTEPEVEIVEEIQPVEEIFAELYEVTEIAEATEIAADAPADEQPIEAVVIDAVHIEELEDEPEVEPITDLDPEPEPEFFDAADLLSQLAEIPLQQTPQETLDDHEPAVTEPAVAEVPAAAEPEPQPEPEPPLAQRRRDEGPADTAALLRELSSLGLDTSASAPRPATARPSNSASAAASQQARKRKGLFGRG